MILYYSKEVIIIVRSQSSIVWILSKNHKSIAAYSSKEKASDAFKRYLMTEFYWGNAEKLMTDGYPHEFSKAMDLLSYKDLYIYPLPLF